MTQQTHIYSRLVALVTGLLLCLAAWGQTKTRGIASYYHDSLHGRKMANGKPYNRDSMTCAHLQFPLGTRLLVTNVHTKKQIVVHVTDRGPYSRKFVIDLSRRAATELGIIGSPFAVVEMVPVGSDYVIPFRITDLDSIEVPRLELEMTPFGDAPAWTEDSVFRSHIANTHTIQQNIIIPIPNDTTTQHRDTVHSRRLHSRKR